MEEDGSAAVDGDSFEREEAKRAREVLENLYSDKGEEGVQTRRETLKTRQEEDQKELKVRKERLDAARRAYHAAEHLAERYDLDAQCGEVHFTAPSPGNRWPSRYSTEAPSEDTRAHWRVEESDHGDKVLIATTVDGEGIFRLPLEATFEDLRERAKEGWRRLKSEYLEAQERKKKRTIWLDVIKEIEDEVGFGSVESEGGENGTGRQDSTLDGWQKNAAKMHACFHENGAPDYLGNVDGAVEEAGGLDSFSFEHTWKVLKREGWNRSDGNIEALVDALEQWAAHFEDEYGERKADWAANPFEWPTGDE